MKKVLFEQPLSEELRGDGVARKKPTYKRSITQDSRGSAVSPKYKKQKLLVGALPFSLNSMWAAQLKRVATSEANLSALVEQKCSKNVSNITNLMQVDYLVLNKP